MNWLASNHQNNSEYVVVKPAQGFTLIELSIVLVIIGLIVGGVLVGRDLISAARLRAQIAQIEKYKTATNTFRTKYNNFPGDIKEPEATGFGFATRGAYAGQGDGNGMLEGFTANSAGNNNGSSGNGENGMFWVDLSKAELIGDSFTQLTPTANLVFYYVASNINKGAVLDN